MTEENTFPAFPNFRKFKQTEVRQYEAYYATIQPYADLNAANLFIWADIFNDLSVSVLDGTLVLRYTNPFQNKRTTYALSGKPISPENLLKIFAYQMDRGDDVILREVPSHLLPCDDSRFISYDDRDSYEYILSVEQHATYPGKAFSRQRRRIGFFEREHRNDTFTVEHRPYIDHALAGELEEFMTSYDTMNDLSDDNLEPIALQKALTFSKKLGKEVFLIRMNNRLVAFCIFVRVGPTAIVNHIKVDRDIQYMFDYSTYRLAQYFYAAGIQEMNFEQDLGLPGLRDHKTRLRPIRFLKKSCILPKNL